jgi:hypothetical protein
VLGGNGTTLAATSSFRAPEGATRPDAIVTLRLVPLAYTPRGVEIGSSLQDVGVPLRGILDWVDRTFPPEDERTFIASVRDVELLARVGWEAPFPERLDERSVLNLEDLPDEIAEGLARPQCELVACAACRALCVRDEFVWKEKQLCAWDYHAQVFGKRGPWHEGVYEERHFDDVPFCAYVAPPLLVELGVEEVLALAALGGGLPLQIVNALIAGESSRAYMAVKTELGYSLLREA